MKGQHLRKGDPGQQLLLGSLTLTRTVELLSPPLPAKLVSEAIEVPCCLGMPAIDEDGQIVTTDEDDEYMTDEDYTDGEEYVEQEDGEIEERASTSYYGCCTSVSGSCLPAWSALRAVDDDDEDEELVDEDADEILGIPRGERPPEPRCCCSCTMLRAHPKSL